MSDEREELIVPAFVQIVTTMAYAFGRGAEEYAGGEHLYGLDQKGRVWEWMVADPEWEGSVSGWELLPNGLYKEGKEPPERPRSR
jgi:hypothetical protein